MSHALATDPAQQSEAAPSAPPRVFRLSFSGVGLWFAALFFAFSLYPSLLPRAGYVQGIASGITVMVGYGLGVGLQTLWRFLQIPTPRASRAKIIKRVFLVLLVLTVGTAIWQYVGWQNEVRGIFDQPSITPVTWPVIVLVGVLVAALILVVA